jgi:hypothetical protein
LGWFHAISLPHVTHFENGCRGAYKHEFFPPEPFLRFSQRTCPIHYFRSKTNVWGGFAQFRCRTSLIPKTGVGVDTSTSFYHRNHFLVFRNEHAQSTTLGPKHMFGVVSRNFVAARHPFRKRVSGCIQSTSFCHRNHFFVFHNEHAQSSTLGPKLMFGVVSRYFVAARHPFRKQVSGCIQARVFATGTISSFFRNEHAQSTNLGPKLMFGVVSRNFVAARHSLRKWVSGCIQSTSFCHQINFFVFRNEHGESTTLGPKHKFGVVSRNFVAARHPFRKRVSRVHTSTSFCHRNHFFVFRNEHAQSTSLGPKLMFGVVSRNFVAIRHSFRKRVSQCIQSRSFCHRNHFFVFRNKHAQSTTLGPKHLFGVVSRNFVAARHPFRKRVSGCIQARVFATGTISSFFATNMPNPLL